MSVKIVTVILTVTGKASDPGGLKCLIIQVQYYFNVVFCRQSKTLIFSMTVTVDLHKRTLYL